MTVSINIIRKYTHCRKRYLQYRQRWRKTTFILSIMTDDLITAVNHVPSSGHCLLKHQRYRRTRQTAAQSLTVRRLPGCPGITYQRAYVMPMRNGQIIKRHMPMTAFRTTAAHRLTTITHEMAHLTASSLSKQFTALTAEPIRPPGTAAPKSCARSTDLSATLTCKQCDRFMPN